MDSLPSSFLGMNAATPKGRPRGGLHERFIRDSGNLPRRAPRGPLKRVAIIILVSCSTTSIQESLTRKITENSPILPFRKEVLKQESEIIIGPFCSVETHMNGRSHPKHEYWQ
jgi:hypothetical protein